MRDHGIWKGLGLGAGLALLAILGLNLLCPLLESRVDPELMKFYEALIGANRC